MKNSPKLSRKRLPNVKKSKKKFKTTKKISENTFPLLF